MSHFALSVREEDIDENITYSRLAYWPVQGSCSGWSESQITGYDKIISAKLDGWGDGCVTTVKLEVETEYPIISAWQKKMNPKKPILHMNVKSPVFADYADGHGECKILKNNYWNCPACGAVVGERRIMVEGKAYDIHKKRFCEKCGQRLDWNAANSIYLGEECEGDED